MSGTQAEQGQRKNRIVTNRSKSRLGRTGIAVLGFGTLIVAGVVLYVGQEPPLAHADPPVCTPPALEPGPGRPWEASVGVSTYSSVNTRNGNVFTAIPIVSWSAVDRT